MLIRREDIGNNRGRSHCDFLFLLGRGQLLDGAYLLYGCVLLVQFAEQMVDLIDLALLLLPLEVDELIQLTEVVQIAALQSMVSLQKVVDLAIWFWL
jgi:hypothetical protein